MMDPYYHQSPYVPAYSRRLQKKVRKPAKTETLKKSIKTVSKEYCAESSICGLKHLVDDKTSYCERYVCESTRRAGELVKVVSCLGLFRAITAFRIGVMLLNILAYVI